MTLMSRAKSALSTSENSFRVGTYTPAQGTMLTPPWADAGLGAPASRPAAPRTAGTFAYSFRIDIRTPLRKREVRRRPRRRLRALSRGLHDTLLSLSRCEAGARRIVSQGTRDGDLLAAAALPAARALPPRAG